MLSDSIRETRHCLEEYTGCDFAMNAEALEAQLLKLRAWEVEARNLEERVSFVDRPHVPALPADIDEINVVPLFPRLELAVRDPGDGV